MVNADAKRGRLLLEESRELVVVLNEEDCVIAASRRAREALDGLREGQPLPEALLEGDDVLEIPYDVDGRRERLIYLRRRGDAAAYEELRAGFTAAVSHELRTPLARLLSRLETALLPGEDAREHVEQARGDVEQVRELIDDVLFLSELETGRQVVGLGSTRVLPVLRDAAAELEGQGIALDGPLSAVQYETRGDERIPIHGGPGTAGVFNAINVASPEDGAVSNVPHGSSFVQAVQFVDGACPVEPRTILTYSQSTNPDSPWHSDQTRMFSRKEWVRPRFCEADILKSPVLQVLRLNGGADGDLIRSLKLARRTFGGRRVRSLVLRVRVGRAAKVSVLLLRGKKVVRRIKAFRSKPGRTRQVKIRARGVRRGAYRLRVTVSDATERKVKTFKVRRV